MENRIVSGMFLPKGINVEPQPIFHPQDEDMLRATLQCDEMQLTFFQIIVPDVGSTMCAAIGTAEVLEKGGTTNPSRDLNLLANTLMDDMEPMLGDMIVFGVINPDTNEVDGNLHDLPEWVMELSESIVIKASNTWNEMVANVKMLADAQEAGVLDEDALLAALESDSLEAGALAVQEIAERAQAALDQLELLDDDQLILDIESFLKGEES